MKAISQGILIFSLTFVSTIASSFPINRLLGDASPEYIQEYSNRIMAWYRQEYQIFSDFSDNAERDYVQYCQKNLKNWGYVVSDKQLFPSFWFSHKIVGNTAKHRKFFCAVSPLDSEGRKKIDGFFRGKKVKPPFSIEQFWGIAFDQDQGHFETYWWVDGPILLDKYAGLNKEGLVRFNQKLTAELEKLKSYKIAPKWLYHEVIKSGQVSDMNVVLPLVELPAEFVSRSPFGALMIAASRIVSLKDPSFDLVQLKDFNLYFLSPQGFRIGHQHLDKFNQYTLRMIWASPKEYELFYP